jgi:ATP-dependent Clp protease ATP-binding subunit ClpA
MEALMFERYTEKARRVIFFARYEACQLGSQSIDPEHILLGILREDKQLVERLFSDGSRETIEIRTVIEQQSDGERRMAASVDLPLSRGSKAVLHGAADASDRLGHRCIAPEHLILGLIGQTDSLASELLSEHGVTEERFWTRVDWIRPSATAAMPPSFAQYMETNDQFEHADMMIRTRFEKLIGLLKEKGVLAGQETELLESRHTETDFLQALDILVDLLIRKAVLSEADRERISGPHD